MPWIERVNQRTGAPELFNEETGETRPLPQSGALAPAALAPQPAPQTGTQQQLQTAGPRPAPGSQDLLVQGATAAGRGIMDFGRGLGQAVEQNPYTAALLAPMFGVTTPFLLPQQAPQARGAQAPTTLQPEAPIDFSMNPEATLSPAFQAYDQRVQDLISQAGTPIGAPPPPTRPDYPTLQADPGLEILSNRATERDAQYQKLLEQEVMDLEQEDPQARNRWARFGEFLSQWAATGRLEAAGAVMSDLLERDRGMARELRREVLRLRMAGMESQDAVIAAQANLLSGQHQAAQATQLGQFGVENQRAEDVQRSAELGFETGERARLAALGLQGDLAGRAYEEAVRQEERSAQALTPLLQGPYASQVGRELGGRAGLREDASGLIGRELEQNAIASALTSMVAGRNDNEAIRTLSQIDPNARQLVRQLGRQNAVLVIAGSDAAREYFATRPALLRPRPTAE